MAVGRSLSLKPNISCPHCTVAMYKRLQLEEKKKRFPRPLMAYQHHQLCLARKTYALPLQPRALLAGAEGLTTSTEPLIPSAHLRLLCKLVDWAACVQRASELQPDRSSFPSMGYLQIAPGIKCQLSPIYQSG